MTLDSKHDMYYYVVFVVIIIIILLVLLHICLALTSFNETIIPDLGLCATNFYALGVI